MLKSWRVENFKAIVASGDLRLAPVTVLAGLNSSGKSSLLQSVLMVAQTLSNPTPSRALLPNGPLVQLGRFEHVLHQGGRVKREVTLGFEMDWTDEIAATYQSRDDSEEEFYFLEEEGFPATSLRLLASFHNEATHGQQLASDASHIVLDHLSLTVVPSIRVTDDEWEYGTCEIVLDRLDEQAYAHFISDLASPFIRLLPKAGEKLPYVGHFTAKEEKRKSSKDEPPDPPPIFGPHLVGLSHFLPDQFLRKYSLREELEDRLKFILWYLGYVGNEKTDENLIPDELFPVHDHQDDPVPEELRQLVAEHFPEEYKILGFSFESIFDLRQWERQLDKTFGRERSLAVRRRCQQLLREQFSQLVAGVHPEATGLEMVRKNRYALNLEQAMPQLVKAFASNVRYLGPLRNDPGATQRFAPGSERGDVGSKGEYAATVYDAHQQTRIDWYHPVHQQREQGTLQEAVDEWVRYLGIAHAIHVAEAGVLGFEWKIVHTQSGLALPLASVGVGVSQVLPLLVMGLLSPVYSILLVEQPELHLHPRVQARLADFFMGLAKCKKQCLIETHSEYLVNELRYHLVVAGELRSPDCLVYFVSQNEEGGAQFLQVKVSPSGNVLNWPEGFFDESLLQEDRITAASIAKRTNGKEKH